MSELTQGYFHLFGLLGFYFVPSFIAGSRRHTELLPIAVLNLLLGWTVLGWVAALVWSLTSKVRPQDAPVLASDRIAAVIMAVPFVTLSVAWYFSPS
jgi:hypothetical protein